MLTSTTKRALMGALCVLAAGASACGGGTSGAGGAGAGTSTTGEGGAATSSSTSSVTSTSSTTTGTGGAPSCSPPDCSDGFTCTIDSCNAGTCASTIGPNQGATACPPGQFCTLETGCIAAPACATTQDCEDAWAGDACKSKVNCDPASSVCTFELLDKDGDGHSPQVCGGDDCDDNDAQRFPGNTEPCNLKDNDCDGELDQGATCPFPLYFCEGGVCVCPPENTCGANCVDKNSSQENCGECGNVCDDIASCVGGTCVCPPENTCGALCVDKQWDHSNCGACDAACPADASCEGGACSCWNSGMVCGQSCAVLASDPANCGACGNACAGGLSCSNGFCTCLGQSCGGSCTDTANDPSNCGSCAHSCLGGACQFGQCTPTVLAMGTSIREIAIDDTHVYFTDFGAGVVAAVPKLGGAVTVLVSGLTSPDGIAVDASHVYFWRAGGVMRVAKAGGVATQVATTNGYGSVLAVDATDVYWSSGTFVNRTPKAGGATTVVATSQGNIFEIALDPMSVFWIDDAGEIAKAPKAGGAASLLASSPDAPMSIAIGGGYVYWINYDEFPAPSAQLMQVLVGGGPTTVVGNVCAPPTGLALDSTTAYWACTSAGLVNSMTLDGLEYDQPANGQSQPAALAVDETALFWVNEQTTLVRKTK